MAENTPPDQLDAVIRSKLNCLSTRCEHINHLQPEKKKRALKHLCILCEILGNEKSTEEVTTRSGVFHYKKQGVCEAIIFVNRFQTTNDTTHTTMGQPSSVSDHPKTVLDRLIQF